MHHTWGPFCSGTHTLDRQGVSHFRLGLGPAASPKQAPAERALLDKPGTPHDRHQAAGLLCHHQLPPQSHQSRHHRAARQVSPSDVECFVCFASYYMITAWGSLQPHTVRLWPLRKYKHLAATLLSQNCKRGLSLRQTLLPVLCVYHTILFQTSLVTSPSCS